MSEYEFELYNKILKAFEMNIHLSKVIRTVSELNLNVSKEIDAILEELAAKDKVESKPTTHLFPTTKKETFQFRRN
jgi:hypothetical protein